jgi:hypothetical protein
MFNIFKFKTKSHKELEDKLRILRERLEKDEKATSTSNLSYSHFEENRTEIERKEKENKVKEEADKKRQVEITAFVNKFGMFFFNKYIHLYDAICNYLINGGKVDKDDNIYTFIIKDEKSDNTNANDITITYNYNDGEIRCNNHLFTFKIKNALDKFNKLHHGNRYGEDFINLIASTEETDTVYPYEKIIEGYEDKIDNLLFSNMYDNMFDSLKIFNSNKEIETIVKPMSVTENENENKTVEELQEESQKVA